MNEKENAGCKCARNNHRTQFSVVEVSEETAERICSCKKRIETERRCTCRKIIRTDVWENLIQESKRKICCCRRSILEAVVPRKCMCKREYARKEAIEINYSNEPAVESKINERFEKETPDSEDMDNKNVAKEVDVKISHVILKDKEIADEKNLEETAKEIDEISLSKKEKNPALYRVKKEENSWRKTAENSMDSLQKELKLAEKRRKWPKRRNRCRKSEELSFLNYSLEDDSLAGDRQERSKF